MEAPRWRGIPVGAGADGRLGTSTTGASSTRPSPAIRAGSRRPPRTRTWSGNPNLFTDFSVLSQVERRLTVAQGHVLSLEMLSRLALQAAAGVGRAETSLQEIEATFRDMIDMPTDLRRDAAPSSS